MNKKAAALLSLGFLLTISCVKKEQEQEPQVSNVVSTPCQQVKTKSNGFSDKVDIEFFHEGIKISYYDFRVTCDFTTVNVTHSFVNGVLNITQQGFPNQANCICYTDVSYTINGISQNEVNVIFINGEQVYCYNVKDDLSGEAADEELLRIAYDVTYFYPDGFYKDSASMNGSVYYVNTVSISPINQRDSKWIELSTNDKNEALKWVNLTMTNSNERIGFSPIEENETDKYFEFKSIQSYDGGLYPHTMLFRVHKNSYYHSIFDRFSPWDHDNKSEYGYYNATIDETNVKECVEYLWVQTTFANLSHKVLCSTIKEENEYFEVHISSLQLVWGDLGIRDWIEVYDNYIKFNKNSKLITFQRSRQKQIPGMQR